MSSKEQAIEELRSTVAGLEDRLGDIESRLGTPVPCGDEETPLTIDISPSHDLLPNIYRITCVCSRPAVCVWGREGSPPTEVLHCPCGLIHQPPADEDK